MRCLLWTKAGQPCSAGTSWQSSILAAGTAVLLLSDEDGHEDGDEDGHDTPGSDHREQGLASKSNMLTSRSVGHFVSPITSLKPSRFGVSEQALALRPRKTSFSMAMVAAVGEKQ